MIAAASIILVTLLFVLSPLAIKRFVIGGGR